mmetsp:Transcript_47060/g.155988  ORF Transcript_47060/g.155988 Transcript_47060/m.155988 type:complete len:151 (+) Transcript_47060:428-880(+)
MSDGATSPEPRSSSVGHGRDYNGDSCGSPSCSPSPKEAESGSSLASGASSIEQSLEAQVRSEVERYALTDGHLRWRLVEERGMGFSPTLARAAIDSLSKHIVAAKVKRGTTHYAIRATADVASEEARANLKTLTKNLLKQVERRWWRQLS